MMYTENNYIVKIYTNEKTIIMERKEVQETIHTIHYGYEDAPLRIKDLPKDLQPDDKIYCISDPGHYSENNIRLMLISGLRRKKNLELPDINNTWRLNKKLKKVDSLGMVMK